MRKVKNGILILLTAAVIALCGWLPTFATKDPGEYPEARYRELKAFSYSPLEQQEAVRSYGEKLAVLCGQWLDITPEQTAMTEEGVRRAAMDGLKPYAQLGLLPVEYESLSFFCQPYLTYSVEAPEVMNIIWDVSISNRDYEDLHSIGLVIDDETGAVLRSSFYAAGVFGDRNISSDVSAVASVYLDAIGLNTPAEERLSGEGWAWERYTVYDAKDAVNSIAWVECNMDTDGFQIKIYNDAEMMQ